MNYNKELLSIKNNLTNMLISYKILSNEENIENINNKEQLNKYYDIIKNLRTSSLLIFDKCNELLIDIIKKETI